MIRKKYLYVVIILVIALISGCSAHQIISDSKTKENDITTPANEVTKAAIVNEAVIETDYSDFFNAVEGTAVIYNSKESRYYIYNPELAKKQSSPCSSFKIISCLMGLESSVIKPESSILKWNGTIYSVSDWNKDINYIEAFRTSCIWYFRQVIELLGTKYVQNTLDQLEYGNCDISEWEGSLHNLIFPEQQDLKELNGFWQESSLQISPIEQVNVLRRIFEEKDVFSQNSLEQIKSVMLTDNSASDIKIYGKTGSGIKDDTWNDGWFVGMFEVGDEAYYFAFRLNQPGKRGNDAKAIALNIINEEFGK